MIISDYFIINWHVSHAWYGCWTIKALGEAEVLYDGFTMSYGGTEAPFDHCLTFTVPHIYKNCNNSKTPIS
jgi:hypothetical protein